MGVPLGRPFTAKRTRSFVRDTQGALGFDRLKRDFRGDAVVPNEALDTGYRLEKIELWMVPHDDSFAYLRNGKHAERWPAPRPNEMVGCA